jgi:hypothetical protein
MRQFAALLSLATLALAAGCGGGSSSKIGPPATVTLSPTTVSLTFGGTVQLSAAVTDASGNTVTNGTVAYTTSNSSVADVSTGGLVCAGAWDSESTPVVCTPPKSTQTATATITATATAPKTTITASATTTAYVHLHIDSIVVSGSPTSPCTSQANSTTYTAVVCNGDTPVPGTLGCLKGTNLGNVGTPTWAVLPSGVGVADTTTSCNSFDSVNSRYPCLITAGGPGLGTVSASVSATVSSSAPFATCPVQTINLVDTNNATSTSLSTGSVTLAPTVIDTNGVTITALPTLNYNSSQPVAAELSSATSTATSLTATVGAPGVSTIVVSCSPPNCNTGLYPVYSNNYRFTVTGTTSTSVYVASKTSTSLIPITTSNNTVGTTVTLPVAPNSMVVTPAATKILLGTDLSTSTGVMVYTISGSTTSTLPVFGRVLAVSPDSNTVIIFYGPNEGNTKTPSIYVYSLSGNTVVPIALNAAAVTAQTIVRAAFSPDGTQAVITADNPAQIAIWSSSTAPHVFAVGPGTSLPTVTGAEAVDFLAEGSFAYVTGGSGGNVSVFGSCFLTSASLGLTGFTPDSVTATDPTLIAAVPNSTQAIVADSPNVDVITANTSAGTAWNGTTLFNPAEFACEPPWLETPPVHPSSITASLNVGSFNATQLIVTPDGTKAILLGSQNSVLVYNISANTSSTISLSGPAAASATFTPTGGVTLDSAYLYVGANDNKVHRVNFSTGVDDTQISPGITPDFVVMLP